MMIRSTEGANVSYEDTQKGTPIVVLLHAFPLSHEMWQPQRDALKGMARFITPDLRGFGGTTGFTSIGSLETMADTVAAFLDALGITDKVVLGGRSMGG